MTSHPIETYFPTGERRLLGQYTFTAEKIIAYASKYDPQPFHLDAEAARDSFLGGLCASGWHTASVWMRMQREASAAWMARMRAEGVAIPEIGPSPGLEKLKWLRPVFAGDTITYYTTTIHWRESGSKPGWHIVTARNQGENEEGELVLEFESSVLVRLPR